MSNVSEKYDYYALRAGYPDINLSAFFEPNINYVVNSRFFAW